jgi:hypothetical protein
MMAVTHSEAAKAAMRDAVQQMIAAQPTHKLIAYIACASGHKAVVVEAREGDDVRRIVMDREQGKHGGGVVYLAHERQEDALFARSAMQGAAREDFIRHRVSMLQTTPYQERDPRTGKTRLEALKGTEVRRTPYWQQQLAGEFISNDDIKIDPKPTPFMELAAQAMKGADFQRKLEEVRKDQEELCGIKVGVDYGLGDRTMVMTSRRVGKSWMVEALADVQREASKSMRELVDSYMVGKEPVLAIHDEVQYADPSAMRDDAALAARGSCKPQNRPHKDEKPANPYPPAHPKAQPPAGLMAVSAMDFRMGNRWMP